MPLREPRWDFREKTLKVSGSEPNKSDAGNYETLMWKSVYIAFGSKQKIY